MTPTVIVHLSIRDVVPQPAVNFCPTWNITPSTMRRWCSKNWVPTAFLHASGEYWVTPLDPAFLRFNPSLIVENSGRKNSPTPKTKTRSFDEPLDHPSKRSA